MMKLTRRKFCSLLLLSIALPIESNASSRSQNKTTLATTGNTRSQALEECKAVYEEWMTSEKTNPAHYFAQKMKEYQLAPQKVSEAAIQDFQHHNFFEVNGLQLSKTEAAFLAVIGSSSAT
ncbi:MAG: hypothetical protein L3J89_07590 [Gammaproteobacteria bacterium]|nr:hypothetical protein [Gammaproteobacteria bacterium]